MQLPLKFLDAAAFEEVRVELWRELFELVGVPDGLDPASFDNADVHRVLQGITPSPELVLALEAIQGLGDEDGREALVEALEDRSISVSVPDDYGAREFALFCFLRKEDDPAFADAYVRAQIKSEAVGRRGALHELRGSDARAIRQLTICRERLRELVLDHCKSKGLGKHVQVDAFESEGACVFQIIHGARVQRQLTVTPGADGRAVLEFRPVHCDIIRYEAVTGRLQVAVRSAAMLSVYARIVGKAFFDDEEFFVGEACCTLVPLQERGKELLTDHSTIGIGQVRMTECVWELGDRRVLTLRSHDCFKDIERVGLTMKEGTIVQVKLKVQVVGASTRPVTVTIRTPNKIDVSRNAFQGLVWKFLDDIGVRCNATPTSMLDLWGLYPWRASTSTWHAVFGDDVPRLCASGALVPTTLDSVPSSESGGEGSGLEVHPVEGGEYYGVGKVGSTPSRSLTATDIEGLELDAKGLRSHLISALETSGGGEDVDGDDEALDLGVIALGEHGYRLFYVTRTPRAGLGERLRKVAGSTQVALLVPKGRRACTELLEVQLSGALPSTQDVRRGVAVAAGLEGSVPAIDYAPGHARLVVDSERGMVWFDGVHVPGIKKETQPFGLVLELAKASPAALDTRELSKRLAPGRQDGTQPARHAKRDAKKAILEALAGAGVELDADPFPSAGRGAYRCSVLAFVS